ncbi:DUF177 domain-containing protein [Candidatus Omnitrophota bacterium]
MKIHVDQVPDSGLSLSETLRAEELDLNREDVKFTEPIDISAAVSKAINNLSVELKITTSMHLSCSRCLEEFTLPLTKQAQLNLPIEHQQIIDLTDNLREEIIFSYPLKPLCSADCKGLCLTCGQNLNKGRCNHGAS